jgi:triphosphoribosyl-dephospho-CoA synthase
MITDPDNAVSPSVGLWAQLACIWETTARCPGNAHRFRDFPDVNYVDFLASAAAIAPVLEASARRRVGQTVLDGVRATRCVVTGNTNLGVLLLLAPLAAVPLAQDLRAGVAGVLARLDVADARLVYEAIRLAAPAGLGRVVDQDIGAEPTKTLRQVMELAAERDLVARQYADGFRETFDEGMPALDQGLQRTGSLEGAIVFCHLDLMARHPDSLIARKRGTPEAEEAAQRARQVLRDDWPRSTAGWRKFSELDAWLGGAERGRNPGTTADLVTAVLFVAMRTGALTLPQPVPWALEAARAGDSE